MIKKNLYRTFILAITSIVLILACSNFMEDDEGFVKSIEKEVTEANAPEVTVNIRAENDSMGVTSPLGSFTTKKGIPFEITTTVANKYSFLNWTQVGGSGGEVIFTNAESISTKATVNTTASGISIVPLFDLKPYVSIYLPYSGSQNNLINRDITVTFNEEIDPSTVILGETGTVRITTVKTAKIASSTPLHVESDFESVIDGRALTLSLKSGKYHEKYSNISILLTSDIKDSKGNTMADDFSWFFQTGSGRDEDPPWISSFIVNNYDISPAYAKEVILNLVVDDNGGESEVTQMEILKTAWTTGDSSGSIREGSEVSTGAIDYDSEYNLSLSGMNDGWYRIRVNVADTSDNWSSTDPEDVVPEVNNSELNTKYVYLDRIVPSVSSFSINSNDQYTNLTTVNIDIGSITDVSGIYRYSLSNTNIPNWVVGSTPPSTYSIPSGDGSKTIYLSLEDNAGNTVTISDNIELDTVTSVSLNAVTTPTNTVSQTISGTKESNATVVMSGTASFGTVVYPDGISGSAWNVVASFVEGNNSIIATSTDLAGNSDFINTIIELDTSTTVTIDTVATPTNSATQTITGTKEANATVAMSGTPTYGTVSYPGGLSGTTWSVVATLSNGNNTITAIATDQLSNTDTKNSSIELDTVTTVTINPVTTPTNSSSQTIAGTKEANATVVMSGTPTYGTVSYPAGIAGTTWSVVSTLSEGSNTVIATSTDLAGNNDSENRSVTLDSTTTVTINSVTTPTNSSSQTITGTKETNATVAMSGTAAYGTVSYPGGLSGTTWSVSATLSNGNNTITATATDQLSNTDTSTTSIVLDTSTTVTIDIVATPTNSATQTITGTKEANATVAMSGTPAYGTVNYPSGISGGVWSVSATLSNGNNTITATATDEAGNTDTKTSSIELDTVTTVTINSVTTPTNSSSQTITGTKEANATVVMSGSASYGTVSYPAGLAGTTWSVLSTLSEGSNTVIATSTDLAGNNDTENRSVTLDSTTTVTINSVTTPTNSSSQTITGTKETNATVVMSGTPTYGTVSYPGGLSGTTWSVSATLSNGSNTIAATATDQLSNTDTSTTSIVLDTSTTVTIDTVATPTNSSSQTITGTKETNATVAMSGTPAYGTVSYPGGLSGTTWSVSATLSNGNNTITATATDQLSNTDTSTTSIVLDTSTTVTIDTVATPTNSSSQTITGTKEANATVVMSGSASYGTVSYPAGLGGTTWSVLSTLSEGSNTVIATSTDLAGNNDTENRSVTLDSTTTVTISSVTTPTNSSSQTITGTKETNATVVMSGTPTYGTVSYPGGLSGTTWSISATLSNGNNTITATATDQLSNTDTSTTSIVLDTSTTVTINSVTTPTNSSSQTITGTKETNATVVMSGTPAYGTVSYPGGLSGTTWSVSATLSNGSNTIAATATDQLSNTDTSTTSIVLDTSTTVTINSVTTPTNSSNQTITGTKETNATVAMSGTPAFGTVSYPGGLSGTTWSVSATLSNGNNTITATATDEAGNSDTATDSILLDSSEPTLSSVVHNNISAVGCKIAGTSSENGTMYYYVTTSSGTVSAQDVITNSSGANGGSDSVSASTEMVFNISGLSSTTDYYYHVVAEDNAGNPSAVFSGSFTTL